jgi:hypothetical protein
MKSVNEIKKLLNVSESEARKIQQLIESDAAQDDLNFLPPSLASSWNSDVRVNTSSSKLTFIQRIMPWPFLFIKNK